jgi:hypothetical protein
MTRVVMATSYVTPPRYRDTASNRRQSAVGVTPGDTDLRHVGAIDRASTVSAGVMFARPTVGVHSRLANPLHPVNAS